MKLIFLHGPAASGKLTIARKLQELTGFRLFHNHLVVDTLLAVFPFGSPAFVRLREQMWLNVFGAAAAEGTSVIFTFAPEATVQPAFIDQTVHVVEAAGGTVHFVELTCPVEELERRLENPSRAQFMKLRSVETFRSIRRQQAHVFPPLPSSGLTLDTSRLQPEESARRISQHFHLASQSRSTPFKPYPNG